MIIENKLIVNRIIFNAVVNWITRVIIAASAIVLTPILISGLGKYEYGIWILVGQVISLLLITDLGVANSVSRLISKYDAVGRKDKEISIYSSSILIFFVVMVIVTLAVLFTIKDIPSLLGIADEYSEVTKYVFLIMAVNIIVVFPIRVGRGLLQAKHRFDYIDVVSTVAKLVQLILIFLLYYTNDLALLVLAWIMVLTNIIAEVVIFLKAKKLHKSISFQMNSINRNTVREIFSLGGASLLQSMSSALSRQGMVLIVGIVLGVLYAPLFSIPLMLLLTIGPAVGRIGATFMPIASTFDSLKQVGRVLKLSVYGTRYTFMLGLLISVYIYLYGDKLLTLWLPVTEISRQDIDTIYTILLISIVPFMLSSANQGNRVILLSTGSHWLVAKILFYSASLMLVLGAALMLYTPLGIYGVVVAWVLKLFFADYLLILFFVLKKYSTDTMKYLRTAYAAPLISILPVIGLNMLIANMIRPESLMSLLFNTFCFSITAIASVYFFCLEKAHVEMLFVKKKRA